MTSRTCTVLDHIYAQTIPGATCYCGARTWGGTPARQKQLRPGTSVTALGVVVTIKERDASVDGPPMYRVEPEVEGRRWFERHELEAV